MKKHFFLLGIVFLCSLRALAQGMAVNNTGSAADNSAILDASSATQGMLVPRMTQSQRNAIATPATGLLIYQTDNTPGFYYNTGTPASPSWQSLSGGAPTGAAGGALAGTYPNPTLSTTAATGNSIVTALGNASTGTIPAGRLGTGTATGTTYLDGSGAWSSPAPAGTAGGDLTGSYPSPTLKTTAATGNSIVAALGNATTGTIPMARLGTGTPGATTFLDGTGAWSVPAGGGSGGAIQYYGTTTTATSITANGTSRIDWNSATTNTGGQVASGTFKAAAAGYYLVTVAVQINAGTSAYLTMKVNNAGYAYGGTASNSSIFPGAGQSSLSQLLYLNTNDTIDIYVSAGGASNIVPANTHMAIYKM